MKGFGLVLGLSLMISNFVPLAVQAAVEGVNMQYIDERFPNPTLTNATANTTVNVTGSLTDDLNLIDFSGKNNSLHLQFNNLPEGYENELLFSYTVTLENGYIIDIISGGDYNDSYLTYIYCYTPDAESPAWDYSLSTLNNEGNTIKLQNGVTYDIGAMFLNSLLEYIPVIDTLRSIGVSPDVLSAYLEPNIQTNTYVNDGNFENFFNPLQHKVISSELGIGIKYHTTEDFVWLARDIKLSSSNVSIETSPSDFTSSNETGFATVFNSNFYSDANPDLKAVFGTDEASLFNHFVSSGMAEGRQGSAEFNVHAYRANNPDLVVVFGDDLASYYQHYMNSGKAEGRLAR